MASWLLIHVNKVLDAMGFSHDPNLQEIIYVAFITLIALAIGWVMRFVILYVMRKIVGAYHTEIGQQLLDQNVLATCSHIIPPLVIMALIPFALVNETDLTHLIMKVLIIYTIIVTVMALSSVMRFIWMRFDHRNNTKNLPLKGILNVALGLLWIIATIVAVSVLIDKSPAALLTGLGAFAAVMTLVFKDSILGFVAGIQLSQNDMLRVGDWIVVPSTIANGIVIDVSLTAVKVQNWDNTIVTLPPYTLVSTSFQNWRGMTDAGWRLISRNFYFDTDSILPLTDDMIQRVIDLPGVKEFVDKVKSGGEQYDPGVATVNGSLETNLGLFRAYMCYYLLHHPLVATDQQILVNLVKPSPEGMPLQIYCYTTTAWTAYEAVQSEIFEHIALTCPRFGLRAASADYREVRMAGGEAPSAPVASPKA
ncbi:MAG: mechanosensitive ion channel family protein [Pseudoflavonifractor sp.]|nr:mechanosensitive ion channel family protein [Pseudoflavonifractor sp.]